MIDALAGRPWVYAIGLSLLQFLWQGAIAAMLTALFLHVFRDAAARTRYGIACAGLALMIVAAGVTLAGYEREFRRTPLQQAAHGGTVAAVPQGTTLSGLPSVDAGGWSRDRIEARLPAVVIVWAAGVFALTLHLLTSWVLVERLKRVAAKAAKEAWQARLRSIADSLGVTRAVRVIESSLVDVPTVIGWLRPAILLPASVIAGVSPFQLDAILAHELAHIRRHDYLVNVLQSVAETLLFYHPAVWWVSRQIRKEREFCCDDLAAEVCGDRLAYARALASLEELRADRPALVMAATGGDLVARVRRLTGVLSPPRQMPIAWLVVSVLIVSTTLVFANSTASAPVAASSAAASLPIAAPPAAAQAPRDPVLVDRRPALGPEEQVKRLEEQFRVAKLRHDVGALSDLLDDAFVETNQNGNTNNKAQALELWRTFQISSLVIDSLSLRSAGDTMIATGAMTEKNADLDYLLFTRIWKRGADDRWRLLSASQFRDPRTASVHDVVATGQPPAGSVAASGPAAANGSVVILPATRMGLVRVRANSETFRVGGEIREPKKIKDVKPFYPADAHAAGVQGIVVIDITVDPEGKVSDAQVLRSIPQLDQAAIDAVRQWKYMPTLLNGTPVSLMMTVWIMFAL
jgi:TonB family protein